MPEQTALNDRLSVLLLRVAQQIDREVAGKELNANVLSEFGEELAKATGGLERGQATFLHSDPLVTEAFAKAIAEISNRSPANISELNEAINKIIERLKQPMNKDALSEIKRFCLALHRSIMAQSLPPIHEGENAFEEQLGFIG